MFKTPIHNLNMRGFINLRIFKETATSISSVLLNSFGKYRAKSY